MVTTVMEGHVEEFVSQPRLAVLSTVSGAGRPQATVVWYAYEDGAFWFNVSKDSIKARNVRANPEVALTVDERTWPYKQAVVYGRAQEASFDEEQARRIAVRYLGEEAGEEMHRHMMENTERVRLRVNPEHIYWQDFDG